MLPGGETRGEKNKEKKKREWRGKGEDQMNTRKDEKRYLTTEQRGTGEKKK